MLSVRARGASSLLRSRVGLVPWSQRVASASSTAILSQPELQEKHQSNARLRSDVKVLGRILGDAIKLHTGEDTFSKVEEMRKLAMEWRNQEGHKALEQLNESVSKFTADDLGNVSRAFAHFLALANVAETQNRVWQLRNELITSGSTFATPDREDSCLGTIKKLLAQGKDPKEIHQAIISQKVELVLTAHPTEVNRRTYLNKQKVIAGNMEKLSVRNNTPYEEQEVEKSMERAINSIWNSDLIRRVKPTPIDEAKGGLAVVEQVLWDAVPSYLRKLDSIMQATLGIGLPVTAAPVRFASWMGGDRDGNPNVTPNVTRAVLIRSRWQALRLLIRDMRELKMILASTKCNDELRQVVGEGVKEPYRAVIKGLEVELEHSLQALSKTLSPSGELLVDKIPKLPIENTSQVQSRLLLLHRSLVDTNQQMIADGYLTDVIRRLSAFGLTLLPLDLRQESTRHAEALDAITRYLGIGSYLQWDEETRQSWLLNELVAKRPLLPKEDPLTAFNFSDTVVDTLETFKMLPEVNEEALGAYIISMAKRSSDVLAVKLLMKEFGLKRHMRVVPLFETLDDLYNAYDQVEMLFSNPWYRGSIGGKQEIMIGYSDSSKDAGRIAALWGQFQAQEKLSGLADKYNIELTFFHGKGGTVSRGGNPSMYKALISQPPGLNGRFRVTEQGEMISQNFGHIAIAERTLDLYSAGVLSEKFNPSVLPKPEWRVVMKKLADLGCEGYRKVVRGDPRFVPYFRSATPEPELGTTNIGSRPQKRRPGGVESLRAIPWVFSWTQTRLHLTTWLGVGGAIDKVRETDGAILDDMYRNWPFFYTNIDLVDMILAKADPLIAENYDRLLVTDPEHKELGKELRGQLQDTINSILRLSGNQKLQQDNPDLQWALIIRNQYIDALNVLQAHVLKRLRNGEFKDEEERQKLQDALVVTINGISQGLRNSG